MLSLTEFGSLTVHLSLAHLLPTIAHSIPPISVLPLLTGLRVDVIWIPTLLRKTSFSISRFVAVSHSNLIIFRLRCLHFVIKIGLAPLLPLLQHVQGRATLTTSWAMVQFMIPLTSTWPASRSTAPMALTLSSPPPHQPRLQPLHRVPLPRLLLAGHGHYCWELRWQFSAGKEEVDRKQGSSRDRNSVRMNAATLDLSVILILTYPVIMYVTYRITSTL